LEIQKTNIFSDFDVSSIKLALMGLRKQAESMGFSLVRTQALSEVEGDLQFSGPLPETFLRQIVRRVLTLPAAERYGREKAPDSSESVLAPR
jgi:hypothetical protein